MRRFDIPLLVIIIVLTFFGLLMIYDASSVIAFSTFGDKYHYIKDQIIWMILGFLALFIFSRLDYHKLFNLALPSLICALILLVLVFMPGIGSGAKGANRWINIFSFRLQPAEFVKLALALYLGAWFSHKEKGRFIAFSLLLFAVMVLIMLQPDLGTATIILAEAIIIYFLSGGSVFYFLVGAPFVAFAGYLLIKLEPYRASRLSSFLSMNQSLSNTSYHVKQILIALGAGGVWGLGIGNSIQKYAYLPENVTDSIFPIIAEEFGFIGASILIILFALLVYRGFYIAANAHDKFGKLLAGGIISFVGIQIIINLGAMTALFPLTGVPLPFISFGGSALIVDLAAMGILLNISRQIN